MSRQRKHERGFTLLELLMVVIIIAILASIAIPQYMRTVVKARRSEALQVMGTLRSAELRYQAERGVFTDQLDALDVQFGQLVGGVTLQTDSWDITSEPGDLPLTDPLITATGRADTTVAGCVVTMLANGELTLSGATNSIDKDGVRIAPCAATN